jgi:hypothetical protein
MITAIGAMTVAGALTVNAQAPQNPPQTTATQQQPDISTQTITITGCVKPESAVPGHKPNPVERIGVSEDYILTNVKMAPASTVSAMGLSTMYEIEGVPGSELKKHINHQIELTGRVAADREVNDESPDFHATTMKMIAATCPADSSNAFGDR